MDFDNATYRRALLDIGNKLTENELVSMKFMCKDIIPGRRLEEITTAIDLWQALEEREKLGPASTSFLRELLITTTDNRLDIVRILDNYDNGDVSTLYSDRGSHRTRNDVVEIPSDLEDAFDLVVDKVGRQWRPVARKLGLSNTDIDCCVEKFPRDLREQVREALVTWVKKCGSIASVRLLCSALSKSQMGMVAQEIQQNCL